MVVEIKLRKSGREGAGWPKNRNFAQTPNRTGKGAEAVHMPRKSL
jgi:hypothetical protein